MKTNEELQSDVLNALKWEPLLNAASIRVTANEGVITLSGQVDSYFKKEVADKTAKSVAGVKAVAEDLHVMGSVEIADNDTGLAQEILRAWQRNVHIPYEHLQVKVDSGWITIYGNVARKHQKDAAKQAIIYLPGIKGVVNDIMVTPPSSEIIEIKDIQEGFNRNWVLKRKDIFLDANKHAVKISGTVSSIYQKEEAERIAWSAPGVWDVENLLLVADDAYNK